MVRALFQEWVRGMWLGEWKMRGLCRVDCVGNKPLKFTEGRYNQEDEGGIIKKLTPSSLGHDSEASSLVLSQYSFFKSGQSFHSSFMFAIMLFILQQTSWMTLTVPHVHFAVYTFRQKCPWFGYRSGNNSWQLLTLSCGTKALVSCGRAQTWPSIKPGQQSYQIFRF